MRETVLIDTPAALATSLMVIFCFKRAPRLGHNSLFDLFHHGFSALQGVLNAPLADGHRVALMQILAWKQLVYSLKFDENVLKVLRYISDYGRRIHLASPVSH